MTRADLTLAALFASLSLMPTMVASQQATRPVFNAASTQPQATRLTVSATTDRGCFLGAPSVSGFPLGTIIDQSGVNAGRLRAGLTGAAITLPESWCNFPDNALTLRATPLSATSVAATPPSGFARLVNYRATASNWQRSGASVVVATSATGNAITGTVEASGQGQEALYRVADIVVQLDQFIAAGTILGQSPLMVASNSYQGSVVVSLGPAILASQGGN
jgi:hypothetical protein